MNITKNSFGTTEDGIEFSTYTMENSSGASVTVSDYGCRLISIKVPDKQGELKNVCLGYPEGSYYLKDSISMGAVVGRCANRIDKGHFTLNGTEYQLAINNGPHHLHGGPTGFGQRVWNTAIKNDAVVFSRLSPDGEENYPGNLEVSVTYTWSEDNELSIIYDATSDQDTPFSLTSHGYFNLDGEDMSDVSDHELCIDADYITELNATQIPTGTLLPVENTPFDFREIKPVGQDIREDHPQLAIGHTYDQNFVINGDGLREAAVLQSKKSGIRLTCFTDQPGLQLYVPRFMPPREISDAASPTYCAVCLETQHFPNAVNIPDFPSVILHPGEKYHSRTLYHFSVI